jgi:hypothetical protein
MARDEITQRTMATMLAKLTAAPAGNQGPGSQRGSVSPRAARRHAGQHGGTAAARAKTGKPLRAAPPLLRGPKVDRHGAIFDEVHDWSNLPPDLAAREDQGRYL